MDRQELGGFLRSRRERLRPEDIGQPPGPRRRAPGLRREEVAVGSHISTEYYVRLEQGRSPRPSGEVLAAIAGALRLTDAESDHLQSSPALPHPRPPAPPRRATRHPHTSPAAAPNSRVRALRRVRGARLEQPRGRLDGGLRRGRARGPQPRTPGIPRPAAPRPRDLGGALYGIADAAAFGHQVVMELRSTVARYTADPAVTSLVHELLDASPEFARLWDRHDVQATPMLTKTFRYPVVGEITVDCDSLTLTDCDQHLVLYTAPPGSSASDALALLDVLGSETFQPSTPSSRAAASQQQCDGTAR